MYLAERLRRNEQPERTETDEERQERLRREAEQMLYGTALHISARMLAEFTRQIADTIRQGRNHTIIALPDQNELPSPHLRDLLATGFEELGRQHDEFADNHKFQERTNQ